MSEEIEPLSFNDFCERYENRILGNDFIGAFTVYCASYWLQQNVDKIGDEAYKNMKGYYENSSLQPLQGEIPEQTT